MEPFKSLFSKKNEKLVEFDESSKLSIAEPCQCSVSVKKHEECLLQIISKLTSIEEQMKEIKTLMKNGKSIVLSSNTYAKYVVSISNSRFCYSRNQCCYELCFTTASASSSTSTASTDQFLNDRSVQT